MTDISTKQVNIYQLRSYISVLTHACMYMNTSADFVTFKFNVLYSTMY